MILTSQCCTCLNVMAAEDFGIDRRAPNGLKSRCNECQHTYNSNYIQKHKDKLYRDNLNYRIENKERLYQQQKAHRAKNKATISVRRNQLSKGYRKKHLGKILVLNSNRRAREAGIPGSFSKSQWDTLQSFFGGICPSCKQGVEKFSIDHIIPISKTNSSHWINNLQPLCRPCNSSKKALNQADYRPAHVREWAEKQLSREGI